MKSLHNINDSRPHIKDEDIVHINITEEFKDYIDIFKKKYLKSDGTINAKAIFINKIFKDYTDFTEKLDRLFGREYIREVMYCILKDINEIPRCPVCNNYNYLRDFNNGWKKTCSKKCLAEFQSNDKEFAEKIRQTHIQLNGYKNKSLDDMNLKYHKDGNYIIIYDYCKHHKELRIYFAVLNHCLERNVPLCIDCCREIYNNYIPTASDIMNFQNDFEEFNKIHNNSYCDDWWFRYYPREKKIIDDYCRRYVSNLDYVPEDCEKYYLFKNKMISVPICSCPNCSNKTTYHRFSRNYNVYCDEHSTYFHIHSNFERDVKSYVDTLNSNVIGNKNDIFDNKRELDIVIPDKFIAIECNGSFFHSNYTKDINYHKQKRVDTERLNYRLLTIWDDCWNTKKNICCYYIKEYLDANKHIIFNEYEIKEIYSLQTKMFLDKTAMYDIYKQYNKSIGLFNNNNLKAICLLNISDDKCEIVHYSTILNVHIDNAYSLFIEYIINDMKQTEIYQTIDNDYCFGQDQENCNMKIVKTDIDWMWFKSGKRYDKSLFSEADNLLKCYNSGTTTYSLIVNNS